MALTSAAGPIASAALTALREAKQIMMENAARRFALRGAGVSKITNNLHNLVQLGISKRGGVFFNAQETFVISIGVECEAFDV